jgi:geranylgeranyl diphosphate synthase type II
MVGGQVIDLISENTNAPIEVLREMDYKKTACLIKAACELGCISANADEYRLKAASEYAECIGIAFQIQDDILDQTSSDEELGKPVGSDNENSKSTYVSLLGIEKCRQLVDELTENAIKALDAFDKDSQALKDFALELANRKN